MILKIVMAAELLLKLQNQKISNLAIFIISDRNLNGFG